MLDVELLDSVILSKSFDELAVTRVCLITQYFQGAIMGTYNNEFLLRGSSFAGCTDGCIGHSELRDEFLKRKQVPPGCESGILVMEGSTDFFNDRTELDFALINGCRENTSKEGK